MIEKVIPALMPINYESTELYSLSVFVLNFSVQLKFSNSANELMMENMLGGIGGDNAPADSNPAPSDGGEAEFDEAGTVQDPSLFRAP